MQRITLRVEHVDDQSIHDEVDDHHHHFLRDILHYNHHPGNLLRDEVDDLLLRDAHHPGNHQN